MSIGAIATKRDLISLYSVLEVREFEDEDDLDIVEMFINGTSVQKIAQYMSRTKEQVLNALAQPTAVAMLNAYQAQHQTSPTVTTEVLTSMLMDVYHVADPKTRVAAVKELRELHGLGSLPKGRAAPAELAKPVEAAPSPVPENLSDLSPEELEELEERLANEDEKVVSNQ